MTTPGAYRSYAGDELITGEGVAVELPVASLGSRIASGLIDVLLAVILGVIAIFLVGYLASTLSLAVGRTLAILLIVAITIGIPATVETLTRGKSLGKLAMGLRTVRDDGGPITFRQALARALIGFVEIYALQGAPAVIAALVNARSKRLGDMAAGTFVASERAPLRPLPIPQTPVALEHWARSADMTALPAGLAVAIRQFLGRASRLNADSRERIGRDLLAAALAHVSPPPPGGIHPEYVLAAVIVERRHRDTRRLAAEDALRRRVLPADPLLSPADRPTTEPARQTGTS